VAAITAMGGDGLSYSGVSSLTADSVGCIRVIAVFLLLMTPVYLLLRLFVKLIRQAYGFDDEEQGPPLRVCSSCNNTVLEPDFEHCPYCGEELPRYIDTLLDKE
jgi:hypothetical protein